MLTAPLFKIYGYANVFPLEAGFVMPVFESENKFLIEVARGGQIDKFIELPDSYLPLVRQYPDNLTMLEGEGCIYAFKWGEEVYYGDGKTLSSRLKLLSSEKILNVHTRALVDKFIDKFNRGVPKDKISIMIADDHKLIREVWKYVLNDDPRFEVIGECGDTQEAVEFAKTNEPQIVLMDINMTPFSGIEATQKIRKIAPGSKVIGVSMHSQPAYAKKMLQMGAKGYVTKNSPKEEMIKAILEVTHGNKYICEEIKKIIGEEVLEKESLSNIGTLTEREIQIMNFIKQGLSTKEIARSLDISMKTVEVHRYTILKKLKLKNSASLVNFIIS